jgi:hypothetical protein
VPIAFALSPALASSSPKKQKYKETPGYRRVTEEDNFGASHVVRVRGHQSKYNQYLKELLDNAELTRSKIALKVFKS